MQIRDFFKFLGLGTVVAPIVNIAGKPQTRRGEVRKIIENPDGTVTATVRLAEWMMPGDVLAADSLPEGYLHLRLLESDVDPIFGVIKSIHPDRKVAMVTMRGYTEVNIDSNTGKPRGAEQIRAFIDTASAWLPDKSTVKL